MRIGSGHNPTLGRGCLQANRTSRLFFYGTDSISAQYQNGSEGSKKVWNRTFRRAKYIQILDL
jgi:hypothetical protein